MRFCCYSFGIVCVIFLSGTFEASAQVSASSGETGGGDSCIGEPGFVHPGISYNETPLVESFEVCCSICSEDSHCKTWSFSVINGTCLLKDEELELVPHEDYVSGILEDGDATAEASGDAAADTADASRFANQGGCYIENGVLFPGGDVLYRGYSGSARTCCTRCRIRTECFSWYFNRERRRCTLNRNVPSSVYASAYSGGTMI